MYGLWFNSNSIGLLVKVEVQVLLEVKNRVYVSVSILLKQMRVN